MVKELLLSFVHEPWVKQIDFSSLEKTGSSFVSDDLRHREDDIIWKVRIGEEWIYLYILLEFQSTVDRFMAVRLLTYTGLLYQDLIKSGQVKGKRKLPPVFPLVLYNGQKRWNAATDLSKLLVEMPEGLEQYQPSFRYLAIDEGSYKETELTELGNLVSSLFQLEHGQDPETLHRIIGCLVEWLSTPDAKELRRDFVTWLKCVFLPDRIPETDHEQIEELMEVQTMLEKRVKQWQKQWKAEGIAEGLAEGELRGRLEGELRGRLEGELRGKLEAAKGLILHGVTLDVISASTGLTRDVLEKLRRDMES